MEAHRRLSKLQRQWGPLKKNWRRSGVRDAFRVKSSHARRLGYSLLRRQLVFSGANFQLFEDQRANWVDQPR